jgi:hypothetical protein
MQHVDLARDAPPEFFEQCGLADPRLTSEEDHASLTRERLLKVFLEAPEVGMSFE